jgi:hypothetical protein
VGDAARRDNPPIIALQATTLRAEALGVARLFTLATPVAVSSGLIGLGDSPWRAGFAGVLAILSVGGFRAIVSGDVL